MIRTRSRTLVSLLALYISALAGLSVACNKVPPNLTPVGKISFGSDQAGKVVTALQKFTIDAEAAGVVTKADKQAVGKYTEKISKALIDLEDALAAGSGQADAKRKAIAIVIEALKQLPDHLTPRAAELVKPYLEQIELLLRLFA